MSKPDVILHATCVALAGRGVLIVGPSGSGKSSLALQLIALGADLVSDDRTAMCREGDILLAAPPPTIAGMIEARGVGILPVPYRERVEVVLVVDMAHIEENRLPLRRMFNVLEFTIPCLHKVDAAYFPAAVHTYVTHMENETT